MTESALLPRRLLLGLSAGQGFALYLLYRAHEFDYWPSQSPLWSYPLWTLAVAVPILLLLSLEKENQKSVLRHIGAFAAVLVVLAIYIGWQATPFGEFRLSDLTFVYIAATGLACFKALMYLQQRAAGRPMTYEVLFTYSWRNFLTLALSAIFVFAFWLILMLWAQLFKSIGIRFFFDLFREEWFAFPVLGFANGLGVIIFRNLVRIIDSITRLLQGLIKLLLPLVLFVALFFILSLPFVGLDALWSTGNGTALLLWLLAITLFFTNAVYQDGRGDSPYPPIIHRALYAGLLILPVVSALGFYGLYLRLAQYGWTVERCWAFLVWLILTLFALGYAYGIVRKRDNWTEELARVNTRMGLVVMALMLVTNSPLLDFRKISLASQMERVDSGEIALANFDYWYAHRTLARPGYLAVEKIKEDIGDSDPALLKRINDRLRPTAAGDELLTFDEYWERVIFRPTSFDIDDDLKEYIFNNHGSARGAESALLFRDDLDQDGSDDYLLVISANSYVRRAMVFYRDGGNWSHVDATPENRYFSRPADSAGLEDAEIMVETPRFRQVRIGTVVIRPHTVLDPEVVQNPADEEPTEAEQ